MVAKLSLLFKGSMGSLGINTDFQKTRNKDWIQKRQFYYSNEYDN